MRNPGKMHIEGFLTFDLPSLKKKLETVVYLEGLLELVVAKKAADMRSWAVDRTDILIPVTHSKCVELIAEENCTLLCVWVIVEKAVINKESYVT